MNMLATNKQFKNGLLTGMILAKQIHNEKKMTGGRKVNKKNNGMTFKKVLAIAAGPLGWVWLARHKSDEEVKELQKKLEKYESPPQKEEKPKKVKHDKKEKHDLYDLPDDENMYDEDFIDDDDDGIDDYDGYDE